MVPPLNTAEPATSALAPAAASWPETSGPTPPSTSMSIGRPAVIGRMSLTLPRAGGVQGWPAEPGVDRHHKHQIDQVEHIFDRAGRCARIDRDAGLLAERADRLQGAVQM